MNPHQQSKQILIRSIGLWTFLTMTLTIGCADKKRELEPRPNTRPMVNQIQQAEQDWIWISAEQWTLISLEGAPPIPESQLRLRFKQHTWLEGDAGCNRFTAGYSRKADAGLKVDEILSTRMFCATPPGVMQQEARFFNLLKTVDSYHAEPDQLKMLADGIVILTFEPYQEKPAP